MVSTPGSQPTSAALWRVGDGVSLSLVLYGPSFRTELTHPQRRCGRQEKYDEQRMRNKAELFSEWRLYENQAEGSRAAPSTPAVLRATGVTLALLCGSTHPAMPSPRGVQWRCTDAATHAFLQKLLHSIYVMLSEPRTEGCSLARDQAGLSLPHPSRCCDRLRGRYEPR